MPITVSTSEGSAPLKSSGELAAILKKINADKPGVVMRGSQVPQPGRIPTGVFEFDLATGGGFPKGRISIVYGPESSGKTNIVYKAIAAAQAMPAPNNKCVLIDLEGSFDAAWAHTMGVDTEALILVKPAYGEEAVDMAEALVMADDVALVAFDSIAVMVSTRELDKSVETQDVGTAAMLVKRLTNKLVVRISNEARRGHNPAIIYINQTRFKPTQMGDPETIPGGQTMKFLSSLTVRLYGKNEIEKDIHPDLPAWKVTSLVIKKAKVPVYQYNADYKMAMIDTGILRHGDTHSWPKVKGHLEALGKLVKLDKGGYSLFGETYPKLIDAQHRYYGEIDFRLECQKLIFDNMQGQGKLVGAEGAAKE